MGHVKNEAASNYIKSKTENRETLPKRVTQANIINCLIRYGDTLVTTTSMTMAALMNSDDENDGENEFDNEVCRRRYF